MVKEGILEKPATIDPEKVVYIYPTIVIALICILCSVKCGQQITAGIGGERGAKEEICRGEEKRGKNRLGFPFQWWRGLWWYGWILDFDVECLDEHYVSASRIAIQISDFVVDRECSTRQPGYPARYHTENPCSLEISLLADG
ncbi:hypothetical protein KSP40_PGU008561 [Platanthera guangdongensis]|uniref:Uncharacterized protein n=1 Tax=Platanthera guangdongensis TaxID=2320717 RepID=A0ABR2MF83_9ASPA